MARTVIIPKLINNEVEVDYSVAKGPKFIVNILTGEVVGMITYNSETHRWGTSTGVESLTGFGHKSERDAIESLNPNEYKVVVELFMNMML